MIEQLEPTRRSSFVHAYNSQLEQHQGLLTALEQKQQNGTLELKEAIQTVHYLYGNMKKTDRAQKVEQQQGSIFANLQAVNQCFGLIAQLGGTTNNRTIQTIGTVGMAVTQGVIGIAQLTGTLGATRVTGVTALGPYGMVISAGLTIAMSFMGGSGNKAMMKALQQISKQIANMHNDMLKGFNVIIDQQKFTIELIHEGFRAIDDKLYQILLGQQMTHDSLDEVLKDVKDIKATLQKMGIEVDLNELNSLKYELDSLPELSEIPDAVKFNKIMHKPLAHIEAQLDKANEPKVTALENQQNQFSGWFHHRKLYGLFRSPGFLRFNFSVNDVPNFLWWQTSTARYMNLLQDYHGFQPGEKTKRQNLQILQKVLEGAYHLTQFLSQLSNEDFLKAFLEYYKEQFKHKREQLNEVLAGVSEYYGRETMLRFAQVYISGNEAENSPDWSFICSDIENKTRALVAGHNLNTGKLLLLKREYNDLIDEYRFHLSIILSILNINSEQLTHLPLPAPLQENEYRYYPQPQETVDLSGHQVKFSYLSGQFSNLFEELIWPEYLIADICRAAKTGVEGRLDYLEQVSALSKLMMMLENPMELPFEVLENYFLKQQGQLSLEGGKKKKQANYSEVIKMFNQGMLQETIELLTPILDILKDLSKEEFTLFIGGSGAGKSTLLNVYTGSEYQEAKDSKRRRYAQLKEGSTEAFKVGGISHSETLYPRRIGSVCDSAGWPDNGGDARKICSTSMLDLMTRTVPKIKGMVLVVRFADIDNRADKFIEGILNVGRIMRDNLEMVSVSVGLVISHVQDDDITPEVIQEIIQEHLEREEKKANPNEDEKLIIQVLRQLAVSQHIMVGHVFDKKQTKKELKTLLARLKSQPSSCFEFSMTTDDQIKFNQQLEDVAKQYLDFVEVVAGLEKNITDLNADHQLRLQIIQDLKLKNEKIDEVAKQRQQKKVSLTAEIEQIDKQLTPLKEQSKALNLKIAQIHQSTDLVLLTTLKYEQKAQFKVEEFDRNQVRRHVTFRKSQSYEKFVKEGFTHGLTHGRTLKHPVDGKFYKKHHHKSYVWGWKAGVTDVPLSHAFAFPVEYKITGNSNCGFVDGTANTAKGFRVTVRCPNHIDSSISIEVKTQAKNLPKNQQALIEAQNALKEVEARIARLENDKRNKQKELKQLILDESQSRDLEQLGENRQKIGELESQTKTFVLKEPELKKQIGKAYHQINDHYEILAMIAKLVPMLKTENRNLLEFARQFGQFALLRDDIIKIVGSELQTPETQTPSATASVATLGIYSPPKSNIDTSWYDDEKIHKLLEHYLKDSKIEILRATLGTNWQEGNFLKDALQTMQKNMGNGKVIIPVNLGTKEGEGIHWVLLYIDAGSNPQEPHVYYVDPFGNPMHQDISVALGQVFPKLSPQSVINPVTSLQRNTYDCGPWIVECAKFALKGNGYIPPDKYDIQAARKEHDEVVRGSTLRLSC